MVIFQHTSILLSTLVLGLFSECVTSYLLKWCPLRDDLSLNATWIDFRQRLSKTFSSVEYFVSRFPSLLNHLDMDSVNDQFLSYQTMREEDVPVSLKDDLDGGVCNVDKLWGYLKDVV